MSGMSALRRYHFSNPKRGDFDLNQEEVYLIVNEEQSRKAVGILMKEQTLFVDCEGYHFGNYDQKLGAIQIATQSGQCFVFYITRYDGCLKYLKVLFESDKVLKVFHDCSGDSSVLHANGIELKNVDDTQIIHKVIQSKENCQPMDKATGLALHKLYELYCCGEIPKHSSSKKSKKTYGETKWINLCEPEEDMVKKAAVDVLALREIFTAQKDRRSFSRSPSYKSLVDKQLTRKILSSARSQCLQYETNSYTSDESDSDFEPSDQVRGGMEDQICTEMAAVNPVTRTPRRTETSSMNWGWLAVGAAAVVTAGAVVASAAAQHQEEERRKNLLQQSKNSSEKNKQKQDECIIS